MKELGSESPMESLFDIRSLEAITGGEPLHCSGCWKLYWPAVGMIVLGWRNCLNSQTCKEWPNLRTG